ncbi:uncharacterized protein EV154DRAFT_576170 [Mucor mucedo]|uniref:uncharacterized protein n=1 Tax=Mucor mucedo TaxID=29922 RepID=UPI00222031D8|nr:uncharacterized protein EV154DRAFT_576170 [Mucor mucedo]KAI7879334.1 hypothetical protein EV154DRAFT_576170 [Mucor mucedo]
MNIMTFLTNVTDSHPSPVAPNIRKDKGKEREVLPRNVELNKKPEIRQAEGSTSTQSDNQHRKNRSWFVGEGDDNKPAMDRVKDFLLENNGKYLDIWSEATKLFYQTGAGVKGDVPGVSMSEEFKKTLLENCPKYFEFELHLSDRFTDDSWPADTGTIQDKPFNKETFIASTHNKRSIDDVAGEESEEDNEDKKSKRNKKQKKQKLLCMMSLWNVLQLKLELMAIVLVEVNQVRMLPMTVKSRRLLRLWKHA